MRAEEAALQRAERAIEMRLPRIPRPRKNRRRSARWLAEQLERDAGAGIDMPRWARGEEGAAIEDRDFPWLYALDEIDRHGDKTALLKLLASDAELTPNARRHLRDLIDRYELQRQRGRQRAPS